MQKYWLVIQQNIFRNPTRAVLTLLGIFIAIAVFSFIVAISNGLGMLLNTASDQGRLVVFQQGRYCPTKSNIPVSYEDKIRSVDGVEVVMPLTVLINKCKANFEMVTINGIDPWRLPHFRKMRMTKQEYLSFLNDPQGAIVGAVLAQRLGWKKGDKVTVEQLRGIPLTIHGIYNEPGTSHNGLGFAHIDHVKKFTGTTDEVTEYLVKLRDGVEFSTVAQNIDRLFESSAVKTKSRKENSFISEVINDVKTIINFSKIVAFIAVFILLLGVGNTIYITIIDRSKEIAIYRALGFVKRQIFMMIVSEAAITSVIGGILGVAATGIVLHYYHLGVGVEGHTITIIFSSKIVLLSIAVALLIGILGAILPAFIASKKPVASELRNIG